MIGQDILWLAEGIFKTGLPLAIVFTALHIYHRR